MLRMTLLFILLLLVVEVWPRTESSGNSKLLYINKRYYVAVCIIFLQIANAATCMVLFHAIIVTVFMKMDNSLFSTSSTILMIPSLT